MRRRAKITIETERILRIREREFERRVNCDQCAETVVLLTVDEAARIAQVSSRAIYRLVEAGKIHFIETNEALLLICFNSLCFGLSHPTSRVVISTSNLVTEDQEG